ncbi:TIGR02679 domain-containing protein [Streptomyces sp. NPDC008086]|uniref:TIGR02679 domain-containing protein n=1 Tax=Streptomyces sp. NPDC008086 TaxID=3364807 RepID=UPI0036E195FA
MRARRRRRTRRLLQHRQTPLTRWADRIQGDGLVRRLARTPEAMGILVEAAVRTLRALPASPPTSRATFAAQNLSGAHALDEGTPLASLVLSGIRCLTGFPDGSGARWRREAWASAGLPKDDLSSGRGATRRRTTEQQ